MNKAWIRLLLALLAVNAVFGQTCLYSDGVTAAGSDLGTSCSCYSGYFSSATNFADCTLKADAQCAFEPAPQQLATGYIPQLDEAQSSVQNGEVTLVIRSPLVTSRLNAQISMQNGDASCSYPGNLWVKSVTQCNDTFTVVMPLSSAELCGWVADEDNTYSYLRNILYITQYDQIGEQRGVPLTRSTQSIVRVEIRFPKRITVTSEISVISSVNLLAAITLQAYDPVSGTGVLEYTTSLQYPFKLSDVTNLIVPSPLIANYSLTDIDCPDTQNAPCTQKIRLVLIPNGACELTGQYNLTTAIACRGDQALCPLDANTNSALIASRVISEDFCEIIRFDIDLSGNLVVFQDAQYTTPKTAFLPSQTAYFLATVWSSKATIVSASISSVFYTLPDDTSRSLYDAAANTALANANQFAITPKNATAEGFQFVISVGSGATDMFPVLVDANAQFQFSAVVEVEWQGLDGLLNNKRFVFGSTQSGAQPSGVQDKKFDSPINVTPLNNVGQTPSASQPLGNPAFSSASPVVVSLASAAVAFLALF